VKTKLKLKKICRGMYIDHKNRMGLDHELVWSKEIGRKWIAYWHESYMGLMVPDKRTQKFDTMAEARAFLNRKLEGN
jgi:hypothetical protein